MAIPTNDKYPIDKTKTNKIAGYNLENPFWATASEGGVQLPGGKADQFLALKNTTTESPGIDDLEWRDVSGGDSVIPTEGPILKGKVLKTKKTVSTELTKNDVEWAEDTGLTDAERTTLNKVEPLSTTVGSLLETVADMQTETSDKFDDIDTDLSTLSDRVTSAEQNIGENATNIATNTSTIASNYNTLDTKINNVKTDLDADIDALEATTSQHTTEISNLQTAVHTNTENIATNSDDIDALETLTATHTQNISDLQTTTTQHTTDISNLQTEVHTNTETISTHTTSIATNSQDIDALETLTATHTTDIAANTTAIGTNTSNINALTSAFTDMGDRLSDVETDVSNINSFNPTNEGTDGQILTKTNTGYQWGDLAGDDWVYYGEIQNSFNITSIPVTTILSKFKVTIAVTDNNSNVNNYTFEFPYNQTVSNKIISNQALYFQAYNANKVDVEFKMVQKYNDAPRSSVWYKINKIDGYTQTISSINNSTIPSFFPVIPKIANIYDNDARFSKTFTLPVDITSLDLDNHNGLVATLKDPNSQNRWIFVVHKVYKDSATSDAGYLFVGQMYWRNANYINKSVLQQIQLNRLPIRTEMVFTPTDDNQTNIFVQTQFIYLDGDSSTYTAYNNWRNYNITDFHFEYLN